MAKRKMQNDELHSHRVTVRFTDFEYEEMCDRAQEAHMPLSAYVRQQAFYNNIKRIYPVVFDSDELTKIVHEIGKIGINLNQIAKHYNSGGNHSYEMEDEIHECIDQLMKMRKEVLELGGKYN